MTMPNNIGQQQGGGPDDIVEIVHEASQETQQGNPPVSQTQAQNPAQSGTQAQNPAQSQTGTETGRGQNPAESATAQSQETAPNAETIIGRLKGSADAEQAPDPRDAQIAALQQALLARQQSEIQHGADAYEGDPEGDPVWEAFEDLIYQSYEDPEAREEALSQFRSNYDATLQDDISASLPDLLLTLNEKIDGIGSQIYQQNAPEPPHITQTKNNIARVMVRGHGMNFNPNDQQVREALFAGDRPDMPLPQFENLLATNLNNLLAGVTNANGNGQAQGGLQSGLPPSTITATGSSDGSPIFSSAQDVSDAFVNGQITDPAVYDRLMEQAEAAEMAALA